MAQAIGLAERKRDLGADDDEGDVFALHERDEAGDVIGGDRVTRDFLGDAGITGGADHARGGGRGEQGADERVFASAGADDEKRAGKSGKRSHGKRKSGYDAMEALKAPEVFYDRKLQLQRGRR